MITGDYTTSQELFSNSSAILVPIHDVAASYEWLHFVGGLRVIVRINLVALSVLCFAVSAFGQPEQTSALELGRSFVESIHHIAPVSTASWDDMLRELNSSPDDPKLNRASQMLSDRWEVIFPYGNAVVDLENRQIVKYMGYPHPDDEHWRTFPVSQRVSEGAAQQLANQYLALTNSPFLLRVDPDYLDNPYRFSGMAWATETLPIIDSEVEVCVGKVTGNLEDLKVTFPTKNGKPPTLPSTLTPGISADEAVVSAAQFARQSGSPTQVISNRLGVACLQQDGPNSPNWFSDLTPEQMNDYQLGRTHLVYEICDCWHRTSWS